MAGNPVRMFFVASNHIYRIRLSSNLINYDSKSFHLFFFPAFDGNVKLEELENARIDVFSQQEPSVWFRIYSMKFEGLVVKKQGIIEDFTTLLKANFVYNKIEYVDYAYKDTLIIHLPGFNGDIRPQLTPAHLHTVLFENT